VINPQPGAAIFEQIAAVLREQIRTGQLQPGQPVPSERSLAGQYGVARETIRRAHQMLRHEGLLARRRGQSLVVREQPTLRDLTPPPGSSVVARMPAADERAQLGLPDGVALLVVTLPGGSVEVRRADRWRLHWPT
jgi:DNA-binding transcriptional MocR family regulator